VFFIGISYNKGINEGIIYPPLSGENGGTVFFEEGHDQFEDSW
jgi:hypothetical protein